MPQNIIQIMKANGISFATLVILVGFIVQQSKWQQTIDDHIDNTSLHMPFQQKVQLFVPRIELESRLDRMELRGERLESKIDKLLEK